MERKLYNINKSITLTLPKQLCEIYGWKIGTKVEVEPDFKKKCMVLKEVE
jgi:bifunctional DNA-binding transcriptional regulator/antitoxin component of YhaV-PrlF toxin-antitoxin module